jgi:hypothetical protein
MLSSRPLILCFASVVLRLILQFIHVNDYLTTRIEVTTLSNGLPSIKEGAYFFNRKIPPYDGSSSRATPISIQIYQLTTAAWPVHNDVPYCLLLAFVDIIAAVSLRSLLGLAWDPGWATVSLTVS